MGTGREGGGNWEGRGWKLREVDENCTRREWELGGKGVGTVREGGGNWERRVWELGEKGMGTWREWDAN